MPTFLIRLNSAVILAALLLSGCGFHLRGSGPGASLPFKAVYVQASDASPVSNDLRRYIASGGTKVAADPKSADALIAILSEGREKQILTLNSQGRVREYTLLSKLTFQVKDAANRELMPPTEVVARRVLSFNESQVLAKENEESALFRDMQSDLIQQMLRRVAALKSQGQPEPDPQLQSGPQFPPQTK